MVFAVTVSTFGAGGSLGLVTTLLQDGSTITKQQTINQIIGEIALLT